MKWFKHLTGALNDNLIFESIERFGGDGYLVFFGTLETIADEFDIFNPGSCRLSIKKLTKNFQISRQKLVKILSFFDQKAKEKQTESKSFFVCFEKDHVVIKCNRLAELCDEHTQKLLKKNRESVGSESGLTPAIEEEVEERSTPIVPKRGRQRKEYSGEFLAFYKAYPNKTGKAPAFRAWEKERPDIAVVLTALSLHVKSEQWKKENGKYIPNPATWINQRRWEDEIPREKGTSW